MPFISVKKIQKHLTIAKRKIGHVNALKKLKHFDNQTLHAILNAYHNAKHKELSINDEEILDKCEAYRNQLLKDESPVSYSFFGSDQKSYVGEVCRKAASPKIWSVLLYSMAKNLGSKKILEIGTNLGVSGTYLLEAQNQMDVSSMFVTMEGLPQFCEISANQFSKIVDQNRFQIYQGIYDETFPKMLEEHSDFDLLFIDGNHKKEPTLDYFQQLKSHTTKVGVFIFDDINWDQEMIEAWQIIKSDKDVNYSIDLYKQGIVIIDQTDSNRNVNFELHYAY